MPSRSDKIVEEIKLCPRCKHSITLSRPPTTYRDLISLSRENVSVLKFSHEYPSSFTSAEKTTLEDEITKTELTLALLKRRQRENRRRERVRASLSAPVRMLPAEILIEVFTYCCRSERGSEEKPNQFEPDGYLQTLTLSHVSSHWKNTVLSEPNLWSDISICLPIEYKPAFEDLLALYFSRSQNALLDISLDVPDMTSEAIVNKYGDESPYNKYTWLYGDETQSTPESSGFRILNMLHVPGRSRCRSLTADCSVFYHFNLGGIFYSLTDLTITDKDRTYCDWEIESFMGCTSLLNFSLQVNITMPEIEWNQVAQVEMLSGCFEDLVFLQENTASISSVTFVGLGFSHPKPMTDTSLTSLTSLRFEDVFTCSHDLEELNAMFSHLICPRLAQLSVQSSARESERWPHESFSIFLAPTPVLSVLKLENLLLDSRFFIKCFPYLQSVTQLSIFGCLLISGEDEPSDDEAIGENFFHSLIYGNSQREDPSQSESQKFLPSLQNLHLRGRHLELNSVFVDFVNSRRGATTSRSRLIEVNLDFKDILYSFSNDNQICLKELCRDGLKILTAVTCSMEARDRLRLREHGWLEGRLRYVCQ